MCLLRTVGETPRFFIRNTTNFDAPAAFRLPRLIPVRRTVPNACPRRRSGRIPSSIRRAFNFPNFFPKQTDMSATIVPPLAVAPMEGLTDRIWRQAHQRWFGAPGAPARYYAPFISPPENRVLIKKKMAELDPAANPGAPVIPQLLAKDGALAAWMIGELRKMDYTEVNLNFGCPSGTVTAKGKGSGMLRDPVKLDAFLAAVFANAEGPISVKTRLGVEKPEEFAAILDIYNRYPICELTIHPRVMRQLYRGQADRAAFAAALPGCRMPVCYNGDVTTAADLHTLEAQYPQLSGIMVGRGIIADPALFREARGGAPAAREELRGYLDDLYHGYSELFGSAGCAVSRMKGHWFYLIHKFEGAEKLEKQLRKAREPWEYEVVVNQIFTLPFRP